ncbi:MAG: HAMP domain-containing sensor histidine kinase [Nakamurella sp.]
MTLRRRLVLSFAGLVTIAVVLVGGISYSKTVSTVRTATDSALISAATAITDGGPPRAANAPVPPGHKPKGPLSAPDLAVSLVQHISASGDVTVLAGAAPPLRVDVKQRRIAQDGVVGGGSFAVRNVDGDDYRIYTTAEGGGRGAVVVGRGLNETNRILTRVAINTALIGLAIILLAGMAGWWIARQITRRLAFLAHAAETVASTGDLTVTIDTSGRDEVGRLAASMHTMLSQLGQSRDAQRRLVEDAGHELRTPITSLRTNARVLRRYDDLTDEDRARLLDDVDGELKELTTLVNELVELATDTRRVEPAEPVSLCTLLDQVADRVGRRSGRCITVDGDETVRTVQVHAVERAVSNLLDNAVKFDPDGAAPIEIVSREGVIQVSDRGPGVPPDELEKIFDRFHRSDTARSLPGSGLGLAIVRDVATQHGGTVTAAGRAGGGLVITLTLRDQV